MSPVNSQERPPRKDLMINGIRPSPLKISKDSHAIRKPSATAQAQAQPKQRQGPVIIYTHSPKIIHTQARDFMALVQKLTGFSRSEDDHDQVDRKSTAPLSRPGNIYKAKDVLVASNRQEADNDSSSALTDETGRLAVTGCDVNNVTSSYFPTTISPTTNPFFADIPLFTPNSTNLFCSPKPVYKFAESPSMGNLNSPSLLEFMKGLPDY